MNTSVPSTPSKCFRCGKEGHLSYNCPEKPNQQTPQRQNSYQKLAPNTGKVNHVSTETALAEPEVMLGTFDVNSTTATVLFFLELRIHSYHKNLLETIAYHYVPCKILY